MRVIVVASHRRVCRFHGATLPNVGDPCIWVMNDQRHPATLLAVVETWPERPDLSEQIASVKLTATGEVWHGFADALECADQAHSEPSS